MTMAKPRILVWVGRQDAQPARPQAAPAEGEQRCVQLSMTAAPTGGQHRVRVEKRRCAPLLALSSMTAQKSETAAQADAIAAPKPC